MSHFAKSILIIFIIVTNFSDLWAQMNVRYEKGTITIQDGTTIDGYIKGISLNDISGLIYYKKNDSDRAFETINIRHIEKVAFEDGTVYASKEFELDAENDAEVLAKQIADGPLKLYQFVYNNTPCFLIEKGDKQYVLKNDKIEGAAFVHFYFRNLLVVATDDVPDMHMRAEQMDFSETKIVNFVNDYNRLKGVEPLKTKPVAAQRATFVFVFAEIGISKNPEPFGQIGVRFYNAKFSHSLSLNAGVDFFTYARDQDVSPFSPNGKITVTSEHYTGNIFSVPVYAQQNILNGKFRPFVLIGLSFNWLKETHQYSRFQPETGYGKTYGISMVAGFGVEWNITQHILFRSEYRYDTGSHPFFAGIGYIVGK